jgi:hypothetical protein
MSASRPERIGVGVLLALGVLLWLLIPTFPNYDSYFHLVWGREILDGGLPSFDAYAAPTPHPLYLAFCTLLAVIGESADRVLVLVAVVSHVAFTWAVYRLGTAVWDRKAGLVAAFLAGSSFALLLYVARAYLDVPYLAFVLWAAVLEAERPRRGRSVLVLLFFAGLLRPEAWLLSGIYFLFLRRPWRLLPWVVAAPLLWMLVDLVVTGDPLWSLHATSDLAAELGRDTGLFTALREGLVFVTGTAREPVAVAAMIGLWVAWRRRDGRAAYVLVGLAAGGTAAFLLTSGAGLSVLPRYLTVPAVVLCLLAGYLVTRTRWLMGTAVLAGLLFLLVRSDVVGRLTEELRFIRSTHDDLQALVLKPSVTVARRCGPVTLPNYRLVPDTRWILDADRRGVIARSDTEPDHGVALVYTSTKLLDRYGKAAGTPRRTNTPPAGFVPLADEGGFAAFAGCPKR